MDGISSPHAKEALQCEETVGKVGMGNTGLGTTKPPSDPRANMGLICLVYLQVNQHDLIFPYTAETSGCFFGSAGYRYGLFGTIEWHWESIGLSHSSHTSIRLMGMETSHSNVIKG